MSGDHRAGDEPDPAAPSVRARVRGTGTVGPTAAAATPSTCSPRAWPLRQATRRHRTPARVAALCRALDGMALAIELAAARYATLGLDGLESGLDQRLRFLTAGPRVADRHGSLRDAIGWSYDLLSPHRTRAAARRRGVRLLVRRRRGPRGRGRRPRACRRSPTGWPDSPSTACSSSTGASRPGTGRWRRSASTASSGWTRPVSWSRSGPATSGGAARYSPRCADRHRRHRRGLVHPVRPGRRRRRCCARLVRVRGRTAGAGGGRWPPSWPVCCSCAAGRRRRNDGTSRPPTSPPR